MLRESGAIFAKGLPFRAAQSGARKGNLKRRVTKLRISSERITNGRAVFRNPIAPELEEIVDPVNVDLRAHKKPAFHIKSNACPEVQLEMVRAFQVRIGAGATCELIAIGLRIIEFHVHAAEAGL